MTMRAMEQPYVRDGVFLRTPVVSWCILLAIATAPLQSAAEQYADFTYVSDGTSVTITKHSGRGAAAIIPASIDGLPVAAIGDRAFHSCEALEHVLIPDSVRTIGDHAFVSCYGLTNIVIPDGVTRIGEAAFWDCDGLVSITIGRNVVAIEKNAFLMCGDLANLSFGGKLKTIGEGAFSECGLAGNVALPDSITTIGDNAFSKCRWLKGVSIGRNLTTLGRGVLSSCGQLADIEVDPGNPSFDSADGVLFDKCGATLIRYPGGKAGPYTMPDSVKAIGERAFSGCESLTSVAFSTNLEFIGKHALSKCDRLTCVTIPDSVHTLADWAFYNCRRLAKVFISEGVTRIGGCAFSDCNSLEAITVSPGNSSFRSEEGVLFDKSGRILVLCPGAAAGSFEVPHGVETIGNGAFSWCSKLTAVMLPYGGGETS